MATKQYQGFLEVDGTLYLDQYWPTAFHQPNKTSLGSDPDTVKIKVDPTSFVFTGANGKKKTTSVFIGAYVRAAKRTLKSGEVKYTPDTVISKAGQMTIRIQGVDSPELHFSTATKGLSKLDYRQHQGENATVALAKALNDLVGPGGSRKLRCRFFSWVDKPSDVCDSNGRFIGDVRILEAGGAFVIGQWLLEKGWAIPSIYTSMTLPELDAALASYNSGKAGKGLKTSLSSKLGAFDPGLIIRDGGKKDSGKFIHPKLYRRQARLYDQLGRNRQFSVQEYLDYLKGTQTKGGNQDIVFPLKPWRAYLASKTKTAKPKGMGISTLITSAGAIKLDPRAYVFEEAASTLKDSKGKKITTW